MATLQFIELINKICSLTKAFKELKSFNIIVITILDTIHRPVFILISTQLYRFVRTSQETHYVFPMSSTG
jgi:hypothetical protein